MFGPITDRCHNIVAWFLLICISSAYFVLCSSFLWNEIHPVFVIIIVYLFLSTTVFLLLTIYTEPGIIPSKRTIEILSVSDPKAKERLSEFLKKKSKK